MESDRHRGDNLQDQLFVKVFTAARVTIDPSWCSRDVCSGYWRLYRNGRDGASVLWQGGEYRLTPRALHVIPAWVRFSCLCRKPVDHFYVHFELIGLTAVTVRRLFQKPMSLPDQSLPDPTNVFRVKAWVYEAMAELFATVPSQRWTELHAAQTRIAPALRYIEDHLGESLTNAYLATLCHCSEDHFIRLFRRTLGQPPAQYILERRIAAATQRLAFGDESIEQIAETLGFANRYHFTRMFTRRMGVGPATYRQQARV
ncbi:MAG: AraC family transcriptional regulator [Verrucomicrobiae bacterium]|nr:AraC family transcriptional regulator [Verrucomicrobiae bacterium]